MQAQEPPPDQGISLVGEDSRGDTPGGLGWQAHAALSFAFRWLALFLWSMSHSEPSSLPLRKRTGNEDLLDEVNDLYQHSFGEWLGFAIA